MRDGADNVKAVIAHHPGRIHCEGAFARRQVESSQQRVPVELKLTAGFAPLDQ
jgi:hypothetical protein